MSKAVLISIRPRWCELIANGKKTVEVRKSRPKLRTPFKCYIYCTTDGIKKMPKDYIAENFERGKVIGEFVCDRICEIWKRGILENFDYCYLSLGEWCNDDIEAEIKAISASCVSRGELNAYGAKTPCLYGWHISGLKIYDEPLNLSEFCVEGKTAIRACGYRSRARQPEYVARNGGWLQGSFCCLKSGYPEWCENCLTKLLTSPPQSWCYVEELQDAGD